MLATLLSIRSEHGHASLFAINLYVVCDVFNGRSPESSTSPKFLLAISENFMIISIAFVQSEGDETTGTFFFKFNQQVRELILLQRCIKFNPPQSNRRLNFKRVKQFNPRLALIAVLNNRALEMSDDI